MGNSGYSNTGRSYGGNSGSRAQAPARSSRGNQSGNFGGSQSAGRGYSGSFGQGSGRNGQGNQNRDFGRGGQGFSNRGGGGFSIGIGIGGGYYNNGYGYGGYSSYDNEWNTIAQLSGGVALLGALEGDDTLFFAGLAGSLYSIYRYDEDRYSDDPALRLRAAYFSRPYFYRDGRRYDRVMVNRRGERFYQFLRR